MNYLVVSLISAMYGQWSPNSKSNLNFIKAYEMSIFGHLKLENTNNVIPSAFGRWGP